MTIVFSINYHTNWGQRLLVSGSLPELGKNTPAKAVPMEYVSNGEWRLVLNVKKATSFNYKYLIFDEATKNYTEEYMPQRTAMLAEGSTSCFLDDTWRSNGIDKTFYSAAFTEGLILRTKKAQQLGELVSPTTLVFSISAPRVASDFQLAIIGNIKELGNWDEKKALVMSDQQFPMWQAAVDAAGAAGDCPSAESLCPSLQKGAIFGGTGRAV